MNNLKGKVSLLLVIMMMAVSILPIFNVFASSGFSMAVTLNGATLSDGQILNNAKAGDKVNVQVSSQYDEGIQIGYYWDAKGVNGSSTEPFTFDSSKATITIPNFNTKVEHKLQVQAIVNDFTHNIHEVIDVKKFIIPAVKEEETEISTKLTYNNSTVPTNKTVEIEVGERLYIVPSCNKGTPVVYYRWDDEGLKEYNGTLYMPDFEPGSTHTLKVQAVAPDATKSSPMIYTIKVPNAVEPIDDELIIEPWMKENKDLDGLSVSLRVDSDNEDKANKNMYALDEEVIYYIDYANCTSKDIASAKIVFETELDFKVLDSFGGIVDGKKITWEFPNGIEEDQKGTKVLVLKYTSLGKNSVKSKIIHPVADIYNGKKVADSSAVVNLIFRDSDTEITNDEHYPYMFGDEEAPTFRPDDTITRAEGALVLTRIFGMNTSGTKVTKVFSDLDQTYPEAQRAIVAASQVGLINGYEDGTYRPNQSMTRAEFMKIIAKYVELAADEDDIRGMEIKDIENEIKVYKNPTKSYVIGNSTVNEHWASSCVTFLARLNMTPVSSKNKDLRLDEYITRAEVAQLVNFYLLRAPAETSSKTKTQFSDVSKNHKLFGDIVEATREAHTYFITEDATEVVE